MKAMKRAAAVLFFCLSPLCAQVRWREWGPAPITNGPFTGRVSALAASPKDPNLLYAAGADGGVWRTRDGGRHWTPLTDRLPTTAMGALALDPTNEKVIYAGSGEPNFANHSRYGLGLYKSTDGGDHWEVLAEDTFGGRCISGIAVDPKNPKVLYVSLAAAGGFPALVAARGHKGAKGPLGLFKSTDGGRTFVQLKNGLPATLSAFDVRLDPADPRIVYVAVGHIFGDSRNGVYRSTDGGASFVKLGGGLPASGVGRIALAVAPSRPGRVYALVARACSSTGGGGSTLGGWRTDDYGKKWVSIHPGSMQATYGWYLCVATVSPKNPDLVFFGGFSIRRSSNAGAGWTTRTAPHVDNHAFAWDAAGRLIVGCDGGVFRSANNGDSWSSINGDLGVVQCYAGISLHPSNAAGIYAGLQDNGTCFRLSGKSWRRLLGGDGGCTGITPDGRTAFAEYQGTGRLYRSVNGGYFRWIGSGIHGRNCFLPPFAVDPKNPARMIYGTERVYQSAAYGSGWTPISPDLTGGSGAIQALAFAPGDPSCIYAATNDGRIQVTTDGGKTWRLRKTGIPTWPRITHPFAVSSRDPRKVFFARSWFGGPKLLYSPDAGKSWYDLTGILPDVPAHCVALDERVDPPVVYLGTDQGVWRSLDMGRRWNRLGVNLPNTPVVDLRVDLGRKRIVAATQGRGVWSCRLLDPNEMESK